MAIERNEPGNGPGSFGTGRNDFLQEGKLYFTRQRFLAQPATAGRDLWEVPS